MDKNHPYISSLSTQRMSPFFRLYGARGNLYHLGDHKAFTEKMVNFTDQYDDLNEALVFINDGAKWIWN